MAHTSQFKGTSSGLSTREPLQPLPSSLPGTTNLKDAGVCVEAAGVEDGVLPLVEACDLLLQLLVYALSRKKKKKASITA